MTEAQYDWVNEIRMAHGYSPLMRRYNDTGREHQARQIRRALLVCSPLRSVIAEANIPSGWINVGIFDGKQTHHLFAPL